MCHLFAHLSWADAKALVPFLMLARVPLLCACALFVFPFISLKNSLFANLFDVTPQGMIVVTLAALAVAWTTLITGWVILSCGYLRFPGICFRPALKLPEPCHFAWSALLAIPAIGAALWYSPRQQASTSKRATFIIKMLAGILVGGLLGALLVGASRAIFYSSLPQPGLFLEVANRMVRLLARVVGDAGYFDEARRLQDGQVLAAILFLLTFLLYVIVYFLHFAPRWLRVPTVTYILLLIMLTCWTLSGITFALDRWRIPLVLLLGVWLAITAQLPNTDHFYRTRTCGDPRNNQCFPETPNPAEVLLASKGPKIILAAASGGGIQAAAWTARVLTGLELQWRGTQPRDTEAFAKSLRLISSVSGGGVGAMYFVNQYTATGGLSAPDNLAQVVADAKASSLEDVSWGLTYHDLLHVILPVFPRSFAGRGRALEQAWTTTSADAARLECDLTKWANDVRQGLRPASIFNATLVEAGERLLLSTTYLPHPANTVGRWDFHSIYKRMRDVAVVTAARLSATFPYVGPASRADVEPVEGKASHVVDGGYYDNYGMSTLVEWLDIALDSLKSAGRLTSPMEILVIEIRQEPSPAPSSVPQGSDRGWFFQSYAPLDVLFAVRTAGQRSHNQVELKLLQDKWAGRVSIQPAVFEFGSRPDGTPVPDLPSPPLSWHLTARQQEAIESQWAEQASGSEWEKVRAFLS
ncbi:MAG: patatin-like phospholipase family protein [Terriglobales bacterium]